MRHGTNPIKKDSRDYSFSRSFGATTIFPATYSVDAGFPVPNQEAPNTIFNFPALPFGCTGYTQAGLCQDQDGEQVNAQTIFDQTCVAEGHSESQGCDIRNSLSSLIVDGIEYLGESILEHKRTAYFNVDQAPGMDMFDSIRSAILNNAEKYAVSIGTPWMNEWASLPQNGVVPDIFVYNGNPADYSWHNWRICGWITLGNEPYLMAETHQGMNYGAQGISYYSRTTINVLFAISGVAAFTVSKLPLNGAQQVKIGLLERLMFYLTELKTALS